MKVYVVTRETEISENAYDDFYPSKQILGVCKTLESAVEFANSEARDMVKSEKRHYSNETLIGYHGGELRDTGELVSDWWWIVGAVEIVSEEGETVLYSTYMINAQEVRE